MPTKREHLTWTTDRPGVKQPAPLAEVPAIRYAPGLILISAFQNHTRGLKTAHYWTVTHEATGYRIGNDLPKRIAGSVAGVLAALPVDWTADSQSKFFDAYHAVPQNVKELVSLMRQVEV